MPKVKECFVEQLAGGNISSVDCSGNKFYISENVIVNNYFTQEKNDCLKSLLLWNVTKEIGAIVNRSIVVLSSDKKIVYTNDYFNTWRGNIDSLTLYDLRQAIKNKFVQAEFAIRVLDDVFARKKEYSGRLILKETGKAFFFKVKPIVHNNIFAGVIIICISHE